MLQCLVSSPVDTFTLQKMATPDTIQSSSPWPALAPAKPDTTKPKLMNVTVGITNFDSRSPIRNSPRRVTAPAHSEPDRHRADDRDEGGHDQIIECPQVSSLGQITG